MNETAIEVNLPPSEFRGVRVADENPVILTVKRGREGTVYYVGKERVIEERLSSAVREAANQRGTEVVVIRRDERVEVGVEQRVIDQVQRENLKVYLALADAEGDQSSE